MSSSSPPDRPRGVALLGSGGSIGKQALDVLAGLAADWRVVALATGEISRFRPAAATPESVAALAYLVAVGSLIGFTAYAWLLRVAPLPLVATYAYVNPIVAVALGSLILGESVTPRTLVAGVIIIVAVAIIIWTRGRQAVPPRPEEVVEAT